MGGTIKSDYVCTVSLYVPRYRAGTLSPARANGAEKRGTLCSRAGRRCSEKRSLVTREWRALDTRIWADEVEGAATIGVHKWPPVGPSPPSSGSAALLEQEAAAWRFSSCEPFGGIEESSVWGARPNWPGPREDGRARLSRVWRPAFARQTAPLLVAPTLNQRMTFQFHERRGCGVGRARGISA